MNKIIYKLWSDFLTGFGNIKIFKYPFFLIYDPDDYQITGEKTLEIMQLLKPGDVILRGYNRYLDGKFVPSENGWSHGALYVGNNSVIHAVAEGVSEINIIDFTRCDRIAILRPKRGMRKAVAKAREFLEANTPYDFGFQKNVSALYCFELCGECYPDLEIPRKTVSKFFGLVKRHDVFLAESFFESGDFECIFNFNPKHNIDFRK